MTSSVIYCVFHLPRTGRLESSRAGGGAGTPPGRPACARSMRCTDRSLSPSTTTLMARMTLTRLETRRQPSAHSEMVHYIQIRYTAFEHGSHSNIVWTQLTFKTVYSIHKQVLGFELSWHSNTLDSIQTQLTFNLVINSKQTKSKLTTFKHASKHSNMFHIMAHNIQNN